MSRIKFITRFIAYLPDSGDRGRQTLTQAVNRVGGLGLEVLRYEPYLLAVHSPVPLALTGPTEMLLDLFPGTAASTRVAAADFNDAASMEDAHRKAETSAQCYNLLQPTDTGFRLESDALGLKPVYSARTHGGSVMGSRIADLLSLFPALSGPVDPVALYELMGFWVPLAGRTLHRPVQRTLPGGCYRWTPASGLAGRRGRDLPTTPVEPFGLMDQMIGHIRGTALQSLREKTAGAPQPVLLALSGGFDSRLIAALCRDLQLPIRALSHGRRSNKESYSARGVARALRLNLEMVPHRKDITLRYLPEHLRATEGTADPAALSITNLFDARSAPGSALLHGFCGDLQAGSHMSRFSAADFASREAIAAAITRRYYPPSRPNLQSLFSPAPNLDDVRQDVFDNLKSDCPPYQAYQLWYLENRNRRFVGSQFAVLGEHFDMILPFYDRRLFDLWHSLPPIGLMDRVAFRKLMARYYPALARIPHPEESAPIIPNLRWQLTHFYHRLPHRLLARCIGTKRAQRVFLRLYRHDDILTLANLAAPQQRAYMLTQLARLRPSLQAALGVELSPHYEKVLSTDLQALRAMFTAASYARERCGSAPSVQASTIAAEAAPTTVPPSLP